jgi:hypothetical protein
VKSVRRFQKTARLVMSLEEPAECWDVSGIGAQSGDERFALRWWDLQGGEEEGLQLVVCRVSTLAHVSKDTAPLPRQAPETSSCMIVLNPHLHHDRALNERRAHETAEVVRRTERFSRRWYNARLSSHRAGVTCATFRDATSWR